VGRFCPVVFFLSVVWPYVLPLTINLANVASLELEREPHALTLAVQ